VRPETALAWIARVLRVLCAPFVRFDLAGGEELNQRIRAVVLAVNHRSLFDVAAGLIVFHRYRRYPRVLIARTYVEGRWTGPFARAIGAIPVDRGARDGRAVEAAVEVLAEGATILLLPEGRLHWDPTDPISTGPAATGAARIAAAADVPVVAAGMVGTERVWARTHRVPRLNPFRRPTVCVRIADHPVELRDLDPRAATEAVMADVRRLMTEAQAAVDRSG
jgi:putative phosphoserine phosphatase/1-acylglycerol-3-phosphate O-acyltransferase